MASGYFIELDLEGEIEVGSPVTLENETVGSVGWMGGVYSKDTIVIRIDLSSPVHYLVLVQSGIALKNIRFCNG